jgi:hypothetical protein
MFGMPASLRGIVCRLLRNPRASMTACRNIFNALIHKGFVSSAERVFRASWPRFRNRRGAQAEISAWRRPGCAAAARRTAGHIAARDFLRTIAS